MYDQIKDFGIDGNYKKAKRKYEFFILNINTYIHIYLMYGLI